MNVPTEDTPEIPAWLAATYPFERRRIPIGPWRMHFIDQGSGRPILLMHGNPTWSYLWRKVIPELTHRGFRVIAPDMIGLGLSDKPRDTGVHSLPFHGENLAALSDALELDDLVIVGQDWGGPQVSLLAALRPGLVTAAVFANTAVMSPGKRLRATRFHRFSHLPVISTVAFRGLNFPVPQLPKVQGDPSSIGDAELRAYRYPLQRWRDRAAPLALARMVPHRPDHPTLPHLERCESWARDFQGPVALVWGLKDPILGRSLRRMCELFPDAEVTETQAGHFLQEEVPDALTEAIVSVATARHS